MNKHTEVIKGSYHDKLTIPSGDRMKRGPNKLRGQQQSR